MVKPGREFTFVTVGVAVFEGPLEDDLHEVFGGVAVARLSERESRRVGGGGVRTDRRGGRVRRRAPLASDRDRWSLPWVQKAIA